MTSVELSGYELLAWRRAQLATGGRAVDLDWLLDLAGGLRWTDLQALHLDPAARRVRLACELSELASLWQRHRLQHEPLQHLVGRCPWRDLELTVSAAALIPRQETESLVDLALERWRAAQPGASAKPLLRWADLGTGSGALAVALARAFPQASGHAVDCSEAALALARLNLEQHAVSERCSLHSGDWWQPLRPWWGLLQLVLSNPPYIPSAVVDQLDPVVREHEPRLALDGGADGLAATRLIIAGAPEALAPGGWLLIEHHHDQSEAVLDLCAAAGLDHLKADTDLQGVRRFACARRPC
jgi:release factor glutamine methyltransferase